MSSTWIARGAALAVGIAFALWTAPAHAQEIDMSAPAPASANAATQPAPSTMSAQGAGDDAFHKGTLGFAFPITLLSNVVGGVLDPGQHIQTIDLVYFLSDKAAIDVIAGVNFHRQQADDGMGNVIDNNLFGFAVGAGYRAYSAKHALRSFIEPSVVLAWPDTAASETFTIDVALQFGLERSVTSWFSVSGAVGAGLDFTNSLKDIQLATQVNLAANLYWR
jgi:hypothetical protein